jgi:hypothetical protein
MRFYGLVSASGGGRALRRWLFGAINANERHGRDPDDTSQLGRHYRTV